MHAEFSSFFLFCSFSNLYENKLNQVKKREKIGLNQSGKNFVKYRNLRNFSSARKFFFSSLSFTSNVLLLISLLTRVNPRNQKRVLKSAIHITQENAKSGVQKMTGEFRECLKRKSKKLSIKSKKSKKSLTSRKSSKKVLEG